MLRKFLITMGLLVPMAASAQTTPPEKFPVDGAYQTKTTTGLQYTDVAVGDGAVAKSGQHVTVHYSGYLLNGTKFDSSLTRGKPFDFDLGGGQVIKGWDEGVAGMKVGGERLLRIPADLGYGSRGAGGSIPPYSTLLFDVKLLDVK